MCVLRLYFCTNLILHRLHPDLYFVIEREIPLKESGKNKQYSDHSPLEVLLFFNVCCQVVLLDQSNIVLFALEITFCHTISEDQ